MPDDPTEAREVSPLELFYDLVFVFAISQLSQHLLKLRVTTLYAASAVANAAYYTRYLAEAPGEEPGRWSGGWAHPSRDGVGMRRFTEACASPTSNADLLHTQA